MSALAVGDLLRPQKLINLAVQFIQDEKQFYCSNAAVVIDFPFRLLLEYYLFCQRFLLI